LLQSTSQDIAAMPVQDVQRLVYELQIHQLELEMQNEELRRAQLELAAARDRYVDLYDFAPVGYLSLDADGVILETNLTAVVLLGVPRGQLPGQRLSAFVAPDQAAQDALYFHQQRVFAEATPCTCGLWMQRPDGTPFYAQLKSLARRDSDTGSYFWRLGLIDLTAQRQQAEEELAWSAAIVESSHDAIIGTTLDGTIVSWNSGAARLYGYTAAEAIGCSITILAPLERRMEPLHLIASVQRHVPIEHYETQRLSKDGRRLEISLTYSPIANRHGSIIGISMIGRDITARKQHEAQLRATERALRQSQTLLRRLTLHQQQLQEQERAAMAREIHDEVAQALTSLHMDTAWLAARLVANPETHTRLQTMLTQLHDLDTAMHHMAMTLHPRLLDDLGLLAAIEWQLDDMRQRTGMPYVLQAPSEDIPLDLAHATALFRIFQEALTNVVRHAQASQVIVQVGCDSEAVRLTVSDNGQGMTRTQRRSGQALGLIGMRERAQLWDGMVTIKSHPGRGTTVMVRMPLRAAAALEASR
jgi:PAS domain S-box-containing protein